MTKQTQPAWRNRIIESGVMEAGQFLANPDNWRIHPRNQQAGLEGVLDSVGWVQEVIVNKTTGHLVDGHLRVTLALRQGEGTPVPYKLVDLTVEEEALILATLDPIAALAATDREKLDEVMQHVNSDNEDVQKLMAEIAEREKLEYGKPELGEDAGAQVDKAEELREKWGVETGQLWQLGSHRLICGDCTDRSVVERVMAGEKARLIWTDPPYGVNYGATKNHPSWKPRNIINDDLEPGQLEEFIRSCFKLCAEFSIAGAALYAACPAGTPLPRLIAAFSDSGFVFHWGLVWVKDSLVLGRGDYHFKHENILYGWKEDAAHYFVDDRTQTSVFEYPRPKKSDEHPTMKPIELVEHMISNSSVAGDIVYEPFSGSGTTLIACERLGRRCRAVEISPAYCAVAIQRWVDMTGGTPELIN